MTYIYESPDGGKTVYKRKPGSSKREKIEITTNHVFSYKGGPEIWTKDMWLHVSPYIQSITPISEIQETVDEFAEKNDIKNALGVHVRRTDNSNSKKYSKKFL